MTTQAQTVAENQRRLNMAQTLGTDSDEKTLCRMLYEARESRESEAEPEEPYVVRKHYEEQDMTYFDGVTRRDHLTWMMLGGYRT